MPGSSGYDPYIVIFMENFREVQLSRVNRSQGYKSVSDFDAKNGLTGPFVLNLTTPSLPATDRHDSQIHAEADCTDSQSPVAPAAVDRRRGGPQPVQRSRSPGAWHCSRALF